MLEIMNDLEPFLPLVVPIVTGVVVGFLSAWGGAVFALRRFKTEKWWERKADAYTTIVVALHHLKRSTEIDLRIWEDGGPPESDEERRKQRRKQYTESWDTIHKAIDTGMLFLCEESRVALEEMVSAVKKAEENAGIYTQDFDVVSALGDSLDAVKRCLNTLSKTAKKELSVK